MAICNGCGAAIVWAETADGKRQPFDREPDREGNRILLGRGPNRPPLALPLERIDPHFGDEQVKTLGAIYMPHHATCPNVADFQKGAAS